MGVEGLLQELLDGRATIAERVVSRVRTEMPSFAGVPLDEHRMGIEAAVQLIVSLRLEDTEPAFGGGAKMLRELGERRARQGVPVEDLLRSWRMGIEEATAYAREVAPRTDAKPDELFDLFQQAFSLADEAMVSIAGGHRRDATGADPETERRGALVRGALLGRLGAGELHSGFSALALDPVVPYCAFRARSEEGSPVEAVNAALERGDGSGSREGFATMIEQELVGFACGELPRSEFELVALGPPCLPGNLPVSYRTAGRVLAAAESFGLVGVHDLASAGLLAAVIENPELGSALSAQLVEPVAELPGGTELLASVHEWLNARMRVEPAAERLFVHPNTVRYRLRRYEEVTGVDLRETEDIFRVWWALHRERAVSSESAAAGG
jgi:PucR-like helix-turn-helix protein